MGISANAVLRHGLGLCAIIAAGVAAGTWLGDFATDGAPLRTSSAEPRPRILGNPDALVADQHVQPADYVPASYGMPAAMQCRGCGPGIRERRALAEQQRIERMLARGDRRAAGYSYDDYGNIAYLDASTAATLDQAVAARHADRQDDRHPDTRVLRSE